MIPLRVQEEPALTIIPKTVEMQTYQTGKFLLLLKSSFPKIFDYKIMIIEIDEDGIKLQLTIVDTPGFGDNIDNDQR